MTMTLSIEAVPPAGTVCPTETATLTELPTATAGTGTTTDGRSADAGLSLGMEATAATGLAALVAENSALAEALRSLPDALDVPKTEAKPIAAEMNPLASAAVAGTASPSQGVDTLSPQMRTELPSLQEVPTDEAPVVAERLPVVEKAVVIETPVVAEKPVVEKAVVEKAVVIETPVVADKPVVEKAVIAEKSVVAENAAVAEKPVVADRKQATTVPSETDVADVVLQAAPVAQMPVAESVTTVRAEAAAGVAGVASVSAIDVSDMFLSAAEAVAAAVTVSPELMRGEAGEIRVQLRPDVLEGSEVVVAVDGRKMDVTFVPTATHVADAILTNQPLLQRQLVERIAGFEISVGMIQAVATNVASSVGSVASVRTALNNMRRSNGRS